MDGEVKASGEVSSLGDYLYALLAWWNDTFLDVSQSKFIDIVIVLNLSAFVACIDGFSARVIFTTVASIQVAANIYQYCVSFLCEFFYELELATTHPIPCSRIRISDYVLLLSLEKYSVVLYTMLYIAWDCTDIFLCLFRNLGLGH